MQQGRRKRNKKEARKEGRKEAEKESLFSRNGNDICMHCGSYYSTNPTRSNVSSLSLSLSHCLEFSLPPIPWLLFSYATSVVPVGKRRAARSRSCRRWRTRAMRLRESTRLLRWKLYKIVGLRSARIFFYEASIWNREGAYKIVSFAIHTFLLFLINRYLSLRWLIQLNHWIKLISLN